MASVWIQNKNNKYVVRWYVDNPDEEKSESYPKLGSTKEPGTARYRKRELEEQIAKGTYVDPKLSRQTVGKVVEKWAGRANTEGTEQQRWALYNDLGELERIPIANLRASPHVRDWVDVLLKGRPWRDGKPLQPGTVKRRLDMLKTVLNQLVADDVLVKNHAATVKLPPIDAEVWPENLLPLEEGRLMTQAAKDDRIRVMILIAMQCGLRPAEIAGLRVRDIDTESATLSVMQQISRTRVETSVLKTKSSRRTVPMPLSLVAEVKPFMEGKPLDGLLFQTANGKPYSSKDLGGWLHRVAHRTTLSRVYTWRDFRHFYASSLIRHNINVKTVQRRMGHSSAKVTLDIYTHIWPDQDDKTREAIELVWFDAK